MQPNTAKAAALIQPLGAAFRKRHAMLNEKLANLAKTKMTNRTVSEHTETPSRSFISQLPPAGGPNSFDQSLQTVPTSNNDLYPILRQENAYQTTAHLAASSSIPPLRSSLTMQERQDGPSQPLEKDPNNSYQEVAIFAVSATNASTSIRASPMTKNKNGSGQRVQLPSSTPHKRSCSLQP